MNTKSEPTDSGRVGDEVVEAACDMYDTRLPAGWDISAANPVAMRAALEAALAAQGQGEVDLRKYVRHLADALEAGIGMWKVDADLQRLAAAINANLPAPAASPAGVPDVVSIMAHLPDNRAATRAELIRAFRLTAAPSAPEGDGGEG